MVKTLKREGDKDLVMPLDNLELHRYEDFREREGKLYLNNHIYLTVERNNMYAPIQLVEKTWAMEFVFCEEELIRKGYTIGL